MYSHFGHKFLDIKNSSFNERIEKGLNNLELIREKTKFKYENATVLELGTGLHGTDLLLFYILGCNKIKTFDHISHLNKKLMISVVQSLFEKLDNIAKRFGQDIQRLKERYNRINTQGELGDLLSSCNIYTYDTIVPNLKDVEKKSVNLLYSESNLQRISVCNLQKTFKILPDILSENAVSFNRLDTKDFNAIYFKSLWGLNYLKYSDFLWLLMTAEKFNNQNRLREYEFILLLESAGLNTLYVESFVNPSDIEKLKSFRVAKRFQGVKKEELAVIASKIISINSPVKNRMRKRKLVHSF